MNYAERSFLVTGGAAGLGRACVERLVSLGARVVIADRNAAEGQALAAQLGALAEFIATDVTSTGDIERAVALAQQPQRPLFGVVQCAGILTGARVVGRDGPHDLAMFERVIAVNLTGTFNVLRLAAAAMSKNTPDEHGQRGVVVNTASISAYEGQIGQAAYAASKGGVASMTMPAARELARFGIRVVAIAPGVFETPMMAAAASEIRQSLLAGATFPARFGLPGEFAQFVQQAIENPMLNGAVLRLDGAMHMAPK
ncbi:MAG: SDR family NAD(P)-dependent oxidoreductase [Planctomycetes bacterium]|nr:SDR family NAD(P)-dependent oxidoreductase [Planctomycetota bacterium]